MSVDPSTVSFQTYAAAPSPAPTLSGGAIAGIVIAAVALVALLAAIAFLALRSAKAAPVEASEHLSGDETEEAPKPVDASDTAADSQNKDTFAPTAI
jgi:hypothetical protein